MLNIRCLITGVSLLLWGQSLLAENRCVGPLGRMRAAIAAFSPSSDAIKFARKNFPGSVHTFISSKLDDSQVSLRDGKLIVFTGYRDRDGKFGQIEVKLDPRRSSAIEADITIMLKGTQMPPPLIPGTQFNDLGGGYWGMRIHPKTIGAAAVGNLFTSLSNLDGTFTSETGNITWTPQWSALVGG